MEWRSLFGPHVGAHVVNRQLPIEGSTPWDGGKKQDGLRHVVKMGQPKML